jgi:hypothetical protein
MPVRQPAVWLHHGASGSSSVATANAYARHHIVTNRWADVGYSWLIAGGQVLEGRGPGREGAHTAGHNGRSYGICLAGNYHMTPPAARDLDALRWLLSHGVERGWWDRPHVTGGHRDAPGASTACPGDALNQAIPTINRPAVEEPAVSRIVLERRQPLTVQPKRWTPIPMDTIHSGNRSLFDSGYIAGGGGHWLFSGYLRLTAPAQGQLVTRFVRGIGSPWADDTGASDRLLTPGKDFVSFVWPFNPGAGRTGYELWHDADQPITVEYGQLKACRLQ